LDLRYVAFAEKSCDVNMTRGLDITLPKDGTNKIGICAKMAYGDLDPELLVEWFEFAKLVGVDVVQVFYHIVSERAMDVFRYYENTGFVMLLPITLAVKKGSSPRVYHGTSEGEAPRGTLVNLWMDGKVTLNDCWHRLSRYDFVIIMDFDELLLPSLPHKTLLEVFQSSIFFLRHLEHTVSDKLDNKGYGKSSPKTVFLPQRVWQVGSHVLRPLQNYKREYLPKDSHKFLHYRHCKTTRWPDCDMERVSDDDILRFETDWLRAVRLSRFRLNQRGFVKQARDSNVGLKVVEPGENIQVGELEVHVMSAIHRQDYPLPGAFNVHLIGWSDDASYKRGFYCCLANTRWAGSVLQVKAKLLFIERLYNNVTMRQIQFGCTVESSTTEDKEFLYVAFAEKSCGANMTVAREIVVPKDGKHKVAVCIKVVYGDPDPERLVEWLEFSRLVGVDVVQMFYHSVNISRRGLDVLRYYNSTGFVSVYPLTVPSKKGHPPRGFQFAHPEKQYQAFIDSEVPLNDCVHRLHRYDFLIVMDVDELLVPSSPYNTLPQVLQMAAVTYPKAASFFIDTHVVVLDWPPTNNASSIFFLRHLTRTVNDTLDNKGWGRSSPKLVVRPQAVRHLWTHDLTPCPGYTKGHLPKGSHQYLHYRGCKVALWNGCSMERVTDTSILRFESHWVQALNRLPLHRLGFSPAQMEKIRREDAAFENKRLH
ncbi:hypothetical protein BaRGS_00034789, partial [Batillaria attramentaria]